MCFTSIPVKRKDEKIDVLLNDKKMQKKNKSIIYPDYYNNFFCKQDTCRSSCCHGWKVTISRNDYFKLIGLTCSPQLRSSLDTSLYLNHDASPEYYAEIARKWDGKCP